MLVSIKNMILVNGILLLMLSSVPVFSATPDFSAIKDVKEKKKVFFGYFRSIVEEINSQLKRERQELQRIHAELKAGKKLQAASIKKLELWGQRYDVDTTRKSLLDVAEKVLNHLDQIPVSMVLAQAANESAWGTSRFAIKGNNFFGQWCYKKGCGIVPSARDKGTRHEVRKFQSAKESVRAYFRNINSHRSYQKVRAIRAAQRAKGEKLSGMKMVAGLLKYSQRGNAYVKELRSIIRFNKLEE